MSRTSVFSPRQGQSILASVKAIQPTIINALHVVIEKKPALAELVFGGALTLVGQDISVLDATANAFENALIAAAPADLKAEAVAVKTAIDAAFSEASAAYA